MRSFLASLQNGFIPASGLGLPDVRKMPKGDGLIAWVSFFAGPGKMHMCTLFCIQLLRQSLAVIITFLVGFLVNAVVAFLAGREASVAFLAGVFLACSFTRELLLTVLFFQMKVRYALASGVMLFIFQRVVSQLLPWHESSKTGRIFDIASQFRKAFTDVTNIFFVYCPDVIIAFVGALLFPFVFGIHAGYGLFLASCMVFFLIVNQKMSSYAVPLYETYLRNREHGAAKAFEFVANNYTTKCMHLERFGMKKLALKEKSALGAMHHAAFRVMLLWVINNMLFTLTYVGVFGMCVLLAQKGQLTVGLFASAFFFMDQSLKIFEKFTEIQIDLIEARAITKRVAQLLRAEPKKLEPARPLPFPKSWKKVELEKVSLRLSKQVVLKEVSFSIHRGEKLALVGPSGAGKSTIVKLLAKQIAPEKGEVLWGETSLLKLATSDVLKNIAIVPQSVDLFDDTLEANIALDQKMNAAKLNRALQLSHAADFVSHLSKKEKTIVGERGVKLSGGQRQRVAIARAIYRNPELIIFDEATSNLDAISEKAIGKAMEDIFKKRTALIIAHRMATVLSCDRVVVLKKGQVVESGAPKKLLKKQGHFAELVRLQKL